MRRLLHVGLARLLVLRLLHGLWSIGLARLRLRLLRSGLSIRLLVLRLLRRNRLLVLRLLHGLWSIGLALLHLRLVSNWLLKLRLLRRLLRLTEWLFLGGFRLGHRLTWLRSLDLSVLVAIMNVFVAHEVPSLAY